MSNFRSISVPAFSQMSITTAGVYCLVVGSYHIFLSAIIPKEKKYGRVQNMYKSKDISF